MTSWPNICFVIVTSVALITQIILPTFRSSLSQLNPDLASWLLKHGFEHKAGYLLKSGKVRLVDIIEVNSLPDVSQEQHERFLDLSHALKNKFILEQFLKRHSAEVLFPKLLEEHVESLSDLMEYTSQWDERKELLYEETNKSPSDFVEELPKDSSKIEELSYEIWIEISNHYGLPSSRKWSYFISIFLALAFLFIPIVAVNAWDAFCVMTRTATQKHGLLNFFTGKYLHPQRCIATFHWSDPAVVGNTVSFVVQFFQRNGRPYPISNADGVVIEITQGIHKIGVVTELGGETAPEVNTARCKFTARRAGLYSISILLANQHIKGSPFFKKFLPGPPDNTKIAVVQHSSTVVCTTGVTHHILIEPRDSYLNLCLFDKEDIDLHNYSLSIRELEGDWDVKPANNMVYDAVTRRIIIDITLQRPGCYAANVSYCNSLITNGKFEIIVLTEKECSKVQKSVARRSYEGYEARLLPTDKNSKDSQSKAKKVYCYVTPKQLILKEFLLKVIPKRLLTFRLCPSTKFLFEGTDSQSGLPTMSIDDGCQPVVRLACKERNVVCATFSQFMLKNIGGSETFKDKQEHFYHELRRLHSRRPHDRLPFTVSRHKLLESTLKATKGFTVNDWCRSFEVTFQGEEGIDWGGLRREFFELLCVSLFDSSNELFSTFHEEPQAPVHPNPFRPKHLKLKHYEFAGRVVGKCLYESALGGSYRQSVKARFTRSFLAQLIGLRVHYKHFSHDDPSLYSGKVLHILNHGTQQLEEPLYFTDEVVIDGECKVIELEPGGASRRVTDDCRSQYLDALAQYRLCTRVKHEVDSFMSGLNDIVPDNLLCIFDENELELLMCGIEEYSIADLKAHHVVSGGSSDFNRVLYWFWSAVSNFTDEEMARLLQFTTGCSRLPPGGFSQLSPHFHICPSHTYDNLPTAHTCFNQLCLPDYDCYEDFERALLIAIKEGSEGFGMV